MELDKDSKSVKFEWDLSVFNALVQSCDFCPETPVILKYMPQKGKIVELGCGLGRFVGYLSKKRYDITGIEINQKTVKAVNKIAPELDVKQGNVANLSFPNNSISGVISLGVIKHFIEGPKKPLVEMYRILKPGCYAVVTTTSFNYLRRIKYFLGLGIMNEKNWLNFKKSNFIRKIFGKTLVRKSHPLANLPYSERKRASVETFFSYFFTKREFEIQIEQVGFKIVESIPIQIIDGIHHELCKNLVRYDGVKFNPNIFGKILNSIFSLVPFFHNHMHLCVVVKQFDSLI